MQSLRQSDKVVQRLASASSLQEFNPAPPCRQPAALRAEGRGEMVQVRGAGPVGWLSNERRLPASPTT